MKFKDFPKQKLHKNDLHATPAWRCLSFFKGIYLFQNFIASSFNTHCS